MKEFVLLITAFLLLAIMHDVDAGQFTPPGIYDPEYRVLPNGLKVITKQRDTSRSVSIRLKVDVGFEDFSCVKRDTPHFLEHLLFTGTSRHSEYELERWVEDAGGYANAETDLYATTYIVDIYSGNVKLAFDYLHEIITDSQLSQEDVRKTRDIINRERGDDPSWLRSTLYGYGIGKRGTAKVGAKLGYLCDSLVTANNVTREDVVAAYDSFYVPSNMTLVVVGDFEDAPLSGMIDSTFGAMAEKRQAPKAESPIKPVSGKHYFESTLSPVVGTSASVGVVLTAPGNRSMDIYPLRILESYLNEKVNQVVRIDGAYSYAPSVYLNEMEGISVLNLSTDIDPGETGAVVDIIENELTRFITGEYDQEEVESIKLGLLYEYAQGFEANSTFADYYAENDWMLSELGYLVDEEEVIEQISVEDVKRVAVKYFSNKDRIYYTSQPTLTYTQFYTLMTVLLVLSMIALFYLYKRRVAKV